MYFGLTILACWSMHAEVRHRWYFIVVLFAIGWGVTMEIFQLLMHLGRSFDLYDILANSMGALIGAIIYLLTARMKKNPAY